MFVARYFYVEHKHKIDIKNSCNSWKGKWNRQVEKQEEKDRKKSQNNKDKWVKEANR